jgi:predicted HicB family RNase H-like nuclease
MAKTERKPLTFEEDREPPAVVPARRTEPSPPKEQRQQVGARVSTASYRRLKARAALQGVTVATLVEQAIEEFFVHHPD